MSAILKQKLIDIANGFTKYGLWKGGGSGGSSALSEMSDVTFTNLKANDVLKYNGSVWVNDDSLQKQVDTLNSNLKWKYLGYVSGGNPISLPQEYEELWIMVSDTNNIAYEFYIPKSRFEIDSNPFFLSNGYGQSSQYMSFCRIYVTQSEIKLLNYMYNGSDIINNTSLQLHYR